MAFPAIAQASDFRRSVKDNKVTSLENTRKAEKIAKKLGKLQPAHHDIALDARLGKIFESLAGTAEQNSIIIRSLNAAARAAGRSSIELVENVMILRGPGYARFGVDISGIPYISFDPSSFEAVMYTTENNSISQELIALHKMEHAVD